MEKPPVIHPPNPPPKIPPVIKPPPVTTDVGQALRKTGDAVERVGDAAIDFAKNLLTGASTANPGVPPVANPGKPAGATAPQSANSTAPTNTARAILVNGMLLNAAQLHILDDLFHCQFPNGRFWYDRLSGAWGEEGSGPRCVISAGLDLGAAPLHANASHGMTRVFINGRQIGFGELMQLGGYARFWPGRHWIDSGGNFGSEGKPPRGNLQIAQARSAMLTQIAMAMQIGAAMSGSGGSGHHESAISGWGITGVKVYDLS